MKTFLHWGNVGDIIYSLCSVKELAKPDKACMLLEIDHPAGYVHGVSHPLKDICMNRAYAEGLMPLLLQQPYIGEVRI